MHKRPITATSPVATYKNVTARAVPSSFSASSGTTVTSIACATPGTKNRLRKASALLRGRVPIVPEMADRTLIIERGRALAAV
jgi:hypothetical protein